MMPFYYICKECFELVKQASVKRHLSKKHNMKNINQYDDEYIRAMISIYFIIPVQAYRIKDRSLLLHMKDVKSGESKLGGKEG